MKDPRMPTIGVRRIISTVTTGRLNPQLVEHTSKLIVVPSTETSGTLPSGPTSFTTTVVLSINDSTGSHPQTEKKNIDL